MAVLDAPSANPAKLRGLRRARSQRAPCEPVAPTPMPAPVDAATILALQTRVRATRVATGEITTSRLYDVRAFKSVYAELEYLRRLAAAGRHGGTVVTSMPQLVAGLAALHPAWKMTGDPFADRDRHQQSVRRRLRDLAAMGLIDWRVGIDADGEEARTEIELRAAPEVLEDELQTARAKLRAWKTRHGRALNTGSRTGIRNAAKHGRPLSASERQRRGVVHTRARAAARRGDRDDLSTISAPPCGASASPQNSPSNTHLTDTQQFAGRTGACVRERSDATPPPESISLSAAPQRDRTASSSGSSPGGAGVPWDESALLERVATRQAAREPVLEVIAAQATSRASEVASWSVDRGWPAGRVREAWVVARWGARTAAELGAAAAGVLGSEDRERLARAACRYEQHAGSRPTGWPAGAAGALLHIAMEAASRDARPELVAYGVRRLDQVSRRMRAVATAEDPERIARAARRAERRNPPAEPARLAFRHADAPQAPSWWATGGPDGDPQFGADGYLQAQPGLPVPADRQLRRDSDRDTVLMAGWWPTAELDGRQAMADGHRDPAARTSTLPLVPGPERDVGEHRDVDALELARRTGLGLGDVERLAPDLRDQLLHQLRADEQRQQHDRALEHRRRVDELLHGPHGKADRSC